MALREDRRRLHPAEGHRPARRHRPPRPRTDQRQRSPARLCRRHPRSPAPRPRRPLLDPRAPRRHPAQLGAALSDHGTVGHDEAVHRHEATSQERKPFTPPTPRTVTGRRSRRAIDGAVQSTRIGTPQVHTAEGRGWPKRTAAPRLATEKTTSTTVRDPALAATPNGLSSKIVRLGPLAAALLGFSAI